MSQTLKYIDRGFFSKKNKMSSITGQPCYLDGRFVTLMVVILVSFLVGIVILASFRVGIVVVFGGQSRLSFSFCLPIICQSKLVS